MNIPSHNVPSRHGGFTLIELLLVITILGVLVAVVVPRFGAGMSSAKVRTAAQTFMQASRYARTMALLHQMEVDVVVQSGGVIRVEAGPLAGEARGPFPTNSAAALLTGLPTDAAAGGAANTSARLSALAASEASSLDGTATSVVTAAELDAEGDAAEDIRAERTTDGVSLRFLGYADTEETTVAAAATATTDTSPTEDFRIRYHSNGICRPHRVRVTDDDTMTIDLDIDMLGTATVEGEEAE